MDDNMPAENPLYDYRIYTVRGEKVMLDSDLAGVYGVLTKALNQAVTRNERRFPPEFSFQLEQNEWDILRSQIVTLRSEHGKHRKYLPRVFTEHGAIMLASVLNSDRAITASIHVVQAFVRLRQLMETYMELSRRIDELNAKFEKHTGEDQVRFAAIFQELKRLALGFETAEAKPKGRIGFRTSKDQHEIAKAGKKRKAQSAVKTKRSSGMGSK